MVRVAALTVSLVYAGVLYLSGVHLQADAKQALSYLPTILTLVLMLWDVWLWRQRGVLRLAQRPLLMGTWHLTLRPTTESHIPDGGNRGPIDAYIVIEQTYWSIAVRQFTAESPSISHAAVWSEGTGPATRTLTYSYTNRPRSQIEDRSRAHLGTAVIDVVGREPRTLSGYYFTDRYTKGDMDLVLIDRTTGHASLAEARARDSLRP
jgi:SMODS-associating 2TM, beta-strand rich effector domain